ncbi:MAG: hypothetical protein ACE5HX_14300 [bacterium]
MHKKSMIMTFILLFGFILNLCCQKTSETNQESSQTTTKGLVEYMDEYHRVLRPLMHQALPDKDVAAFKENAPELLKCAEKVAAAEIPAKFAAKKAEVETLTKSILAKTKTFYEICQSGSEDEILDTFMAAHDEYEALADIVYKL